MKIAYICADFGIPIFGNKGASVHIREIATAFSRKQHDVIIFSPCTEKYSNNSYQFNVQEIKQSDEYELISKQIRIIDANIGINNRLNNDLNKYLYNLTLYNYLMPIFKKEKFDLVYERSKIL